jgi:thioredoxin reductase
MATSNMLGKELWAMLSHVRIHDQKQDTCVEELSIENSVGDRRELLTDGIFTNPGNKGNNAHLQNEINSNNDESDTGTKNRRHCFI